MLSQRDQNSPTRRVKQWPELISDDDEDEAGSGGQLVFASSHLTSHITGRGQRMNAQLEDGVRNGDEKERESFHSPEIDFVDTQPNFARLTSQKRSHRSERTAKPRKRRKSNWDPFRDPFSTLDVEYHPTRSGGELLEEPSTASKKHKQMKKAKTEKAKRRSKVGFRTDGSAENPRAFIDYILPNRHGRANSLYVSTMQRLQHGTSADGVSKPPWQQVALALDCGLSKHEPSPFYAECSLEDLLEVLPIAASQKLSNVLDQCITILKCSLTPENCLAVLAIADHYHACCSELFDTALRFIEDNFQCVGDTEDFCYLTLKHLLMILRRDRLAVKYESDIYRFVKEWLKVNLVGSKWTLLHFLCPVLSCLRINHDKNTWERSLNDWKPTAANLFASLTNQAGSGDPWDYGLWFGHNRVPTKKVLLAIGGVISEDQTSLDVEYLLVSGNERSTEGWQVYPFDDYPRRNLSESRYATSVVTVNNEVYAIGGAQDIPESFCVLKSIEKYDVTTSSWSSDGLPQMDKAVSAAGVAALDGWIYIVGGCDSSGHFVDRVCRYHPVLKVWQDRAGLSRPRSRVAVCAYEGALYAFGGCQGDSTPSKMVERYNPQENIWERMPDMCYPTDDAAACILGHHLYLFGGGGDRTDRSSCMRFDFRKQNWIWPKSMKRVRAGAAAVAVNGVIYVIGGSPNRKSYHKSVEIYDPATGSWTDGPDLNFPRHMLGLAVVSVDNFNSGLSFPATSFVLEEEEEEESRETECITIDD